LISTWRSGWRIPIPLGITLKGTPVTVSAVRILGSDDRNREPGRVKIQQENQTVLVIPIHVRNAALLGALATFYQPGRYIGNDPRVSALIDGILFGWSPVFKTLPLTIARMPTRLPVKSPDAAMPPVTRGGPPATERAGAFLPQPSHLFNPAPPTFTIMCGIAGQYCFDGRAPDRDLLARNVRAAHTRGPDGVEQKSGAARDWCTAGLPSSIFPMKASSQTSEDGTLWLVYTGEIYNYIELREELIKNGHRFHSQSDTECGSCMLQEWGTGVRSAVQRHVGIRPSGMTVAAALLCPRPVSGSSRSIYTETGGSFLLPPKSKALLEHPECGKRPDDETLGTYLAWGVQDHSARTMFWTASSSWSRAHALHCEPRTGRTPRTVTGMYRVTAHSRHKPGTRDTSRFLSLLREPPVST